MKKMLFAGGALLLSLCMIAPLPAEDKSAEDHFKEGIQSFVQGQFQAAVDAFQKAVETMPKDDKRLASVYDNLGLAYLQLKNPEKGQEYFRKAIETNPKLPLPYVHLGAYQRVNGELAAAVSSCIEALKLNNSFLPAHEELWKTYASIGRKQGYDYDLMLREIYHIETLLGTDVNYDTPDARLLEEMKYLIQLWKQVEELKDGDKKKIRIIPKNKGEMSKEEMKSFVETIDKSFKLPDDAVSEETKLQLVKKARARFKDEKTK